MTGHIDFDDWVEQKRREIDVTRPSFAEWAWPKDGAR